MYAYFPQGAARRLTTQRKNVEIESVGAVKSDNNKVKKFFRMEVGKIPTKKSEVIDSHKTKISLLL